MTSPKFQERCAIVGGGFLGMTLALRLAQQGKSVTLYEAAPSLGGLASAWQLGDIVWDRHYHVTLFSDLSLRSLLRELGLEEQICWQKARTGFYVDSKLHSMSNALEFLRFPPLNLVDKVRLAATILRASRITDWKSLEKIRVSDWLGKWSGPRVLNKIWLPLLRAKLGESYRDTSAAFIWATIARMYAARRTGTKTELFGYVAGGYSRIIRHFEQILLREGVECHVGQAIRAIAQATSGKLRVELTPGNTELFDKVVVTAAAPIAARVCAQLTPAEKKRFQDIRYQGIICASLLLEHSLSDFYITNIADAQIPYTAVIEMSSIVDRQHFGGRALVYLPKYVSSDSIDFNKPDDQIREEFVCALERMYPRFSRKHLLCFQVSRVKHLLPIPTINYSEYLPEVETSVPGLFILNSAHILNGTLNVNETIQLAEVGARRFARQQPPIADYSEHELATAHR
jgi:protoporphyrinogen oxidase